MTCAVSHEIVSFVQCQREKLIAKLIAKMEIQWNVLLERKVNINGDFNISPGTLT